MNDPGEKNLSLTAVKLPELAPQFLDFGSQMRFNRLLAIYRRGNSIFSSRSSLDELVQLLEPQLEFGRVCNDFEWKTLLLLCAAAFQLGDSSSRTRVAMCAERCERNASTRWARMCLSACRAQIRPAEMTTLAGYLDDLDHIGNTAAILLSQAAYTHGNQTLLTKAVARMTLYEEALCFPGHPQVQYYLGLAMLEVIREQSFDEYSLSKMLDQMNPETEQAAFLQGLRALEQFSPLAITPAKDPEADQIRFGSAG